MMNRKDFYKVIAPYLLVLLLCFQVACTENNGTSKTDEITVEASENVVSKIERLSKNQILVCAHRAYHKNAPENSLASIQQAIDANIDIIEIDVNMTRDSVLILMHDKSIDRTTNGKGWVSTSNFSRLKPLYLKINDSVTSHRIPTLNEVLKLAKGKIILNLDIKNVDVVKLYQELEKHQMQNEVFSFIWDKRKIDKILAIDSTYAVLPEVSNKAEMKYYLENVTSKLQHFNEKSFTTENVSWAKTNGIQIFMNSLWKADEEFVSGNTENVDKIIALKPAIIQTDHPKLILNYLKSKKSHN